MEANKSVWHYYQPGFVDPEYVPYTTKKVKDMWGNEVAINTWQKQGYPGLVDPGMTRINWGRRFMRLFENDPCPPGWKKAPDSYCVRDDGYFEPIFYTEKAFIPQRQYWDGYSNAPEVQVGPDNTQKGQRRQISQQTDLRTVDPFTGEYVIYYPGVQNRNPVTYVSPNVNTSKQYDGTWYHNAQPPYRTNAAADMYLA